MGAFMDEMAKAGHLLDGGGLRYANVGGLRATLENGKFTASTGPFGPSKLMEASGFAILRADTREKLLEIVERFLKLAGEGESEIIELMDGPPPQ